MDLFTLAAAHTFFAPSKVTTTKLVKDHFPNLHFILPDLRLAAYSWVYDISSPNYPAAAAKFSRLRYISFLLLPRLIPRLPLYLAVLIGTV